MTKRAFQSFAKQGPHGIIVVSEEDLYADDHEYVRAWPEMFGDQLDLVHVHESAETRRQVEQATAAPGEIRHTRKPIR